MVHHMDKNPLVEVLGSFASNVFVRKFAPKYQVMGYVTSMHIDMRLRFSMNFSYEKFLLGKFPVICWYLYLDAHVARK